MGNATVFGAPVALPDGWQEETVYLFAGPAPKPGTKKHGAQPEGARPTISAARLASKSLDAALDTLGPFAIAPADVLVDEIRDDDGQRHYERVVRFAEPATGSPVQQSTRVYHSGDTAFILVFTTPAIDFKAQYEVFARFAKSVVGGRA